MTGGRAGLRGCRLKDRVEFSAFMALRFLARVLPERVGELLGRGIGLLSYAILGDRRATALGNIRSALGLEGRDASVVAKASFAHLGQVGVEMLRFAGKQRLLGERITVRGREHIDRALAEGRGVLLFTAHLGNWELLGRTLAGLGYRLHPIVQNQANSGFNNELDRLRRQGGMQPIARGGTAVREVLRALKGGDCVIIVADQYAGRDGLVVPFFGRPAATPRGLAVFARATGAPVIPIFIHRTRPGYHEIHALPPFYQVKTDDAEADIRTCLERMNNQFETVIRHYPGQWLWMHRRWK